MPILHVRVAMSAGLKIRDCKTCEETTLLHFFLICGSVGMIPDSRVQLQTKHNEDDSCTFAFILCTHNPYGICLFAYSDFIVQSGSNVLANYNFTHHMSCKQKRRTCIVRHCLWCDLAWLWLHPDDSQCRMVHDIDFNRECL